MTTEEIFYGLAFGGMKEGMIVEIEEPEDDDEKKARIETLDELRNVLIENPQMSAEDAFNLLSKVAERKVEEFEDVRDTLRTRKWGIIEKLQLENKKHTLVVRELEDSEFKAHVKDIAKSIAAKMDKDYFVERLLEDVLMDENPTDILKLKDDVQKVNKVEPKGGCFGIRIGEHRIQIRD